MINFNLYVDECSLHETWRNPLQRIDPKSWLDCFQRTKKTWVMCYLLCMKNKSNNLGSPPKLWIYLWTHSSAALWDASVKPPVVCWLWCYTWSRRPALRVPLLCIWLPPWKTMRSNPHRDANVVNWPKNPNCPRRYSNDTKIKGLTEEVINKSGRYGCVLPEAKPPPVLFPDPNQKVA